MTVNPAFATFLTMNREQLIALLRQECEKAGGQTAWARAHGMSQPYVWDVLSGDKPPSPRLLRALGLEREVVYRKTRSGK